MIHVTAFRPSNGNIPLQWIECSIWYADLSLLEDFRKYLMKFYGVPNIDFRYDVKNCKQ